MTGVFLMKKILDRQIQRVSFGHRPLSLIMIDIDNFKLFNEHYGRAYGDHILYAVAHTLSDYLRPTDVIARYGGEEFVVIIPDISTEAAVRIGERIKRNVQETCPVTLSVGISHYREISESLESLIRDADNALYEAKRKGRNRVEVCEKEG